ncbi:MAG: MmcQ/YjbR family DNA-binding protein [Clostridia bacterium]|nr:MmcQ/YjbR family DNA-binding protein [Clostridia bacterium]
MKASELLTYCLSKEGAQLEHPFGPIPSVIKVNGKIFAEVYSRETDPQVTLKCEPFLAELLREKYTGLVMPGYHVINRNKPYWNTVKLDQDEISDTELLEMVDHSYKEVMKKQKARSKKDLWMGP